MIPLSVTAFVLSFLLGRLGSVLLYQAAWRSGASRRFHPGGALVTFLLRPGPWLVHLPVLALTGGLSWEDLPHLRAFTWVAAGALSLGAAGRWGAPDLGRLFLGDRLLIVLLWLGLWASPACLYPLLLACCCLQYTVAGFPLGPGYSNLLGYEFMRGTLAMALAALATQAALRLAGVLPASWAGAEAQVLAVVLCGQAAGYVPQALAKCALGRHPFAWIVENRLQCLVVNAWLRGWGAGLVSREALLRLAGWVARVRVTLCAAAWLVEAAWLLVLADRRAALGILAATFLFHLAVWAATGLAGYPYLASHAALLAIASSPAAAAIFTAEHALAGAACVAVSSLWVLPLRRHLFRAYARAGAPGPWGRAADPADHLMAWWDGPYMRMYSWRVTTASGRSFRFPVTRFSPYDTILTDIHTHLMILGRGWDLDPRLAADRAAARTGVWGLTVHREDRDRLYRLMDDPAADLGVLSPRAGTTIEEAAPAPDGRGAPGTGRVPAGAAPLIAYFQGLNRYREKGWFRLLWRRPHFPGEDLVPDASPLSSGRLPDYDGSEPVTGLEMMLVKTFYRGGRIELLEEREVARLIIPPSAPGEPPSREARTGRSTAGTERRPIGTRT